MGAGNEPTAGARSATAGELAAVVADIQQIRGSVADFKLDVFRREDDAQDSVRHLASQVEKLGEDLNEETRNLSTTINDFGRVFATKSQSLADGMETIEQAVDIFGLRARLELLDAGQVQLAASLADLSDLPSDVLGLKQRLNYMDRDGKEVAMNRRVLVMAIIAAFSAGVSLYAVATGGG